MWSRGRRSDRGAIPLIPAIIIVLVGAAAAAVAIVVANSRAEKNKNPDVAVSIRAAVAGRDAQDRPHIRVKYTVAVGPGGIEPFTPETRITCYAAEPEGKRRVFIGEATTFVVKEHSRDLALTITPRLEDKDLQGPVRVRCEARRTGKMLAGHPVLVNVPPPGVGPAVDVAAQYAGKYQVVFTRTFGIPLNCDEKKNRMFTVTATGSAAISVLVEGIGTDTFVPSSFAADLSPTGQFSAEMYLTPADFNTRGLLTGGFKKDSAATTVSGTYGSDDGHCQYSFVGTLATSGSGGGLTISLEEISGVDGCEPVLSSTTIPPGKVLVTVVNNTFGFAQTFIYDTERNLVGNTDAPEHGGKKSITIEVVAGKYTVQCDGPGGDDRTVELTVQ